MNRSCFQPEPPAMREQSWKCRLKNATNDLKIMSHDAIEPQKSRASSGRHWFLLSSGGAHPLPP